jgi:hypothetical protein
MQTVIPENIAEVTNEDIAKIEAELVAEFDALLDSDSTDVATMTEIADSIEAIRAEQVARAEAQQIAADAVAALAERVHVAEAEAEIVAESEADSAPADADEAEAVVEIAEETTTTTTEVAEAEASAEENELVTASADKTPKAPSASAVARRSSTPQVAEVQPEVVITAAADVPGFSGGSSLDKLGIAKAMHAKARTLSNGSGMVPVASINLPIEHKLGADLSYNMDVLDKATAPEALTAAGWCAPSNNLYTMFGIDAADGLIDLPTVQITRGGLNVPDFIGYDDAVNNGGLWTWTEADSDGDYGSTKPCVQIPCPSFTDYRLEAEGICVTNGNLTDRAFPELTQRYIQLVLNTHLHRVSGAVVNKIAATSDAVSYNASVAQNTSSAAASILFEIDVQVQEYRSRYRMSVNSVLEAIFPLWTRALIRADLAGRHGTEMLAVTDAMIDEYFSIRGIRAQFLHDWFPAATEFPQQAIGQTIFPDYLVFMIYPAGGYVRGDGGVIDLGVVRDSVLNATNDYTAAWTEQMYLVAQLGPKARYVTVFNWQPLGVTGCCPAPEAVVG